MAVLDHCVVATDSEEVAELCSRIGAPVEMTAPDHPSGTDRVAEVAGRPAFNSFDVIANIQGDEPLLQEEHLRAAITLVRDEGWEIGTCATPLMHDEARTDPSSVKVARAQNGRALYFSRAKIPYMSQGRPSPADLQREPFLRHVGIFAYSRDALARWVALAPTPLEQLESLEQLRPVEAGLRIGVAIVAGADRGVDTPADVLRIEERLHQLELTLT
jgi:3-deoxy-manno-octulosonate cytidylyltransferase (CMP-KDO synthetase)